MAAPNRQAGMIAESYTMSPIRENWGLGKVERYVDRWRIDIVRSVKEPAPTVACWGRFFHSSVCETYFIVIAD
jgi:hypothetical protein